MVYRARALEIRDLGLFGAHCWQRLCDATALSGDKVCTCHVMNEFI